MIILFFAFASVAVTHNTDKVLRSSVGGLSYFTFSPLALIIGGGEVVLAVGARIGAMSF